MRRLFGLMAMVLLVVLTVTGCSEGSSDAKQRVQQEQILQQATDKVGMPNIKHFFERETLRKILEMRDNPDLTTYAYTQALNGKFIYLGRAIGYGIPFSTQFTNPEKAERIYSGTYMGLPQADPNGLFSAGSSTATWLMLINEQTNEPEVLYLEPTLAVFQSKLPRRLVEDWSLPPNY